MFLKEVSNAHQGCIYLIKNTLNSNIVKYNDLKWTVPLEYFAFHVIYSCDDKADFSASLLQSSVSWYFRNDLKNEIIWRFEEWFNHLKKI